MSWESVIGLEVHVQLLTSSKLFSGASTAYGAAANVQACAVDLGLPGTLPMVNRRALEMAVSFGLAMDARIAGQSIFARKNYFYPDLPKGYQISQYEQPVVSTGSIEVETDHGERKTIGITRAHLEEDAGKSLHEEFPGQSAIDLNRAGTPLLEIVSEPDLRSPEEAVAYLKKIHSIVCYLKICDGNMQEGSFRCDANVSVRRRGQTALGTRAELKNLNSFKFIKQAIHHEIERQIDIIESGGSVVQETRLYDPDRNETRAMRGKEEANDYRYFPDPDLLPLCVEPEMIARLKSALPELPDSRRLRFVRDYGLSEYDAAVLTASRDQADYFEATARAAGGEAKLCANWIMGELSAYLNKHELDIERSPVSAIMLGGLIKRIADRTISGKIAKQVFEAMCAGQGDADQVIEAKNLGQVTDADELRQLVETALANCPEQIAQYRLATADKRGKMMGFFVGQVMRSSAGKANPQQVNQILKEKLDKE